MSAAVFELVGVGKSYPVTRTQSRPVLRDIALTVQPGDLLGVVGESGSGKTTLARILVGLTSPSTGSIAFRGQDMVGFGRMERSGLHDRVQMVFQAAGAAFNPRKTIARMLAEAVRPGAPSHEAQLIELLAMVGLAPNLLHRLPHQISGGQKQRVGIARALARVPEVLIADEPTSALDVSVQREIVELLSRLAREQGLTLVVISHDLGLVAHLCRTVLVMRGGEIVERGETTRILTRPSHPYTQELLAAVPRGRSK